MILSIVLKLSKCWGPIEVIIPILGFTISHISFISPIFFVAVYLINTLYYLTSKSLPFFAVFMSLFFVGVTSVLAIACGYFKYNSVESQKQLDSY